MKDIAYYDKLIAEYEQKLEMLKTKQALRKVWEAACLPNTKSTILIEAVRELKKPSITQQKRQEHRNKFYEKYGDSLGLHIIQLLESGIEIMRAKSKLNTYKQRRNNLFNKQTNGKIQ